MRIGGIEGSPASQFQQWPCQRVLAAAAPRECLSGFLVVHAFSGSFDSVDAALRAACTTLRMRRWGEAPGRAVRDYVALLRKKNGGAVMPLLRYFYC